MLPKLVIWFALVLSYLHPYCRIPALTCQIATGSTLHQYLFFSTTPTNCGVTIMMSGLVCGPCITSITPLSHYFSYVL